MEELNYADTQPYPEIKVTAPNKYYADILMEDYAGMASELTAINQYMYHHFVSKSINKDASHLLEKIAIVEMRHLEILAEVIILLGGNPIYGGRRAVDKFWSGAFVFYDNDLRQQLIADLDSEYKAIQNYRRHIDIIQDSYIQAILRRIILDEEVHIKLFREAIK